MGGGGGFTATTGGGVSLAAIAVLTVDAPQYATIASRARFTHTRCLGDIFIPIAVLYSRKVPNNSSKSPHLLDTLPPAHYVSRRKKVENLQLARKSRRLAKWKTRPPWRVPQQKARRVRTS